MQALDDSEQPALEMSDLALNQLMADIHGQEREFDMELAFYRLLQHPALTAAQFDLVVRHCRQLSSVSPGFRRYINRELLMREVRIGPFTPELFQKCLDSGEGELQKYLIQSRCLSRAQVEVLVEKGSNRGTRQMALDTLRNRIYRTAG